MTKLVTIYTSNIPVDCYILKARLETEGIFCFIFDENIVWVNPFKAVAVGGVKLKVPSDQVDFAQKIMSLIVQGKLMDEYGEYEIAPVLENEINRQNEILSIKNQVRKDPSLIEKPDELKAYLLKNEELKQLLNDEKNFIEFTNTRLIFTWDKFLNEFFSFNRSIFTYLRVRPVEYYLDKDLVEYYNNEFSIKSNIFCPNCKSENVNYGYAIDVKWNILYLILSLLLFAPFPLIRKNHHCFNCGLNFKNN